MRVYLPTWGGRRWRLRWTWGQVHILFFRADESGTVQLIQTWVAVISLQVAPTIALKVCKERLH